MAYILGFLYADGSLENAPLMRGKYVRVSSTDKYILDAIKEHLDSDHTIALTTYTKKPRYLLRIGSHILYDSLVSLGLKPQKSLTMTFPTIPTRYLGDFLRGYLDGDGCVQCEQSLNEHGEKILKRLSIYFTSGSEEFLREMTRLLAKTYGLSPQKTHPSKRAFQVRYSTGDSITLFKHLYGKRMNNLYFPRKFARFQKYFNLRPQRIDKEVAKILDMATWRSS